MFITFEGGEGTGKSTQVKLLAERLQAAGRDVLTTREPGGTPEAEALRALLVSGEPGRWTSDEELLLNFAARSSHLRQVVLPALAKGQVVICDRYVDSSLVYQVIAGGANRGLFAELTEVIASQVMPNHTFILDIDPAIGAARAKARLQGAGENRFERKGEAFHQRVRAAFAEIAEHQLGRCSLIDASGSQSEVADRIWAKLNG
jgi:dTMP kinase